MRSLLAGLVLLVAAEASDQEGIKLEALRYNSVERTRSGLTALENGDTSAAIERFDTAKRLDPMNPVTFFNAATARLVAGQEGAADQLQQAIEVAPEQLQPAAHYNLGNARLAEENPAAAVDAYKQVLRLDPAHMDAKFNLELAQRLLEQQQKQQQQQNEESPEGEQSEQSQEEQPQPPEQPQEEPEEEAGEQPEEQRGSGEEEQERQSPLPDFENQEDMTAEQAAAILEAVENLEREQRRQQAAERARKRTKSGKDW